MKILFEIGKPTATSNNLLLEIGPNCVYYGFWNKEAAAIEALGVYAFEETALADELPELLHRFLSNTLAAVHTASAFPDALVVPQKFSGGGDEMIKAVYNQPAQTHFQDAIPEWQLTVAYALPAGVDAALRQSFPNVSYTHVYTPAIKLYSGFMADEQLLLHFSPGYFRVQVKQSGQVLLVQTYRYQSPLDVVYYLLKICSEFGLSQSTTQVVFSGMVEADSALCKEVESYFAEVHFAQPPGLRLPQSDVPQHFFSSLYNLALCVS